MCGTSLISLKRTPPLTPHPPLALTISLLHFMLELHTCFCFFHFLFSAWIFYLNPHVWLPHSTLDIFLFQLHVGAFVKVTNDLYLAMNSKCQSCPTLCSPKDCSLPSSSVHGILQARILERIVFPSPGELPDPGIKPGSHTWWAASSPFEPPCHIQYKILSPHLTFQQHAEQWLSLLHLLHFVSKEPPPSPFTPIPLVACLS